MHRHHNSLTLEHNHDFLAILAVQSHDPQGVLVRLDALHLASPHGLDADGEHGRVGAEPVAHWCYLHPPM